MLQTQHANISRRIPRNWGAISRRALALGMSGAMMSTMLVPANAQDNSIEFWTQSYGDPLQWNSTIRELTSQFEEETGISVQHETVNWSVAFDTWLTVSRGGAAPDCADMYWLHSFSGIGGDEYGPMPLNDYRDEWPNLEENFFPGSLQDVFWNGDFYGIPWRTDIRAMLYRSDLFEEEGISEPPDTWEEIVEVAKQLTERDENGNVTRWGFTFGLGSNNPVQWIQPYYWQAGVDFMTEDGQTATIDNEAMRTALRWMRDLVHEHEVVSPDIMEPSHEDLPQFVNGNVAMVGSVSTETGGELERNYPELNGQWAFVVSPKGPENRDSFSGAGYFGVLRGSDKVEQCVEWLKFLSRDESMQQLSEGGGLASPKRAVMQSEFWSDRPWKQVSTRALEYAHTSQQPAPAWSAIAAPSAGAVLYDLMYDTIIRQQDIDEAVTRAQERMQAELDRSQAD